MDSFILIRASAVLLHRPDRLIYVNVSLSVPAVASSQTDVSFRARPVVCLLDIAALTVFSPTEDTHNGWTAFIIGEHEGATASATAAADDIVQRSGVPTTHSVIHQQCCAHC